MIYNRSGRERFRARSRFAAAALAGVMRSRAFSAAAPTSAPSPTATPEVVHFGQGQVALSRLGRPQGPQIQTQLDLIVKTRDFFAAKGLKLMIVASPS